VIIIGIAAGRCRQRLRLDEVSQSPVILDVLGRGEAGKVDAMRELVARDDLGELGQEDEARVKREGASARSISRRGGPPQSRPDRTVLVSATMRIRRRYVEA
jgi:hypothetical protein